MAPRNSASTGTNVRDMLLVYNGVASAFDSWSTPANSAMPRAKLELDFVLVAHYTSGPLAACRLTWAGPSRRSRYPAHYEYDGRRNTPTGHY